MGSNPARHSEVRPSFTRTALLFLTAAALATACSAVEVSTPTPAPSLSTPTDGLPASTEGLPTFAAEGSPHVDQSEKGLGPTTNAPPRFGSPRDLAELPPSVGSEYRISPDGRWVSYQAPPPETSPATGNPGPLVARSLQTGRLVPLVEGLWVRRHGWLPDSSGVVVVVPAEGGQAGEILARTLGPDSAISLVKAPGGSTFGLEDVAVSPDGRRIAFTVLYDASPAPVPRIGIKVMNVDGTNRRQIVEPEHFIDHLSWSPDGRQVVYFKGKGGTPPDDGVAYVADADGTPSPTRLLLPRGRLAAWSPDGRQALWVDEPMDPNGNADLFVSGWPDLGTPRPVATRASASRAGWAGSSDWITYSRQGVLYLAPADGSGASLRLTPEGEWASAPAWLPGQGIAYHSQTQHQATGRIRLLPSL